MSIIKPAMTAISKSDSKSLISFLEQMSKEEIQELASKYLVKSAVVNMSGTWVEESYGNLVDSEDNVLQEDISVDRSYKGYLELHYHTESLHLASLIPIDRNNCDYDEDYFTPGEMLFGEDYGYPADSVELDCECNGEDRHIREDELDLDQYDEFELSVDDSSSGTRLRSTSISATSILLTLDTLKTLWLPIQNVDHSVSWFLFSILFMSSNKPISALKPFHSEIQEYMESYFGITF